MPKKTILIVDDEPHLIRSLSFVLEKEGYRVESALTGAEAQSKISARPPALVFLDLVLPDIDGLKICRRIKSHSGPAPIRVIVLTAKTQADVRQKALEAGADDFLTKPFGPREVLEALQRVLRPSDTPGP